jgi:hypothetical protein
LYQLFVPMEQEKDSDQLFESCLEGGE